MSDYKEGSFIDVTQMSREGNSIIFKSYKTNLVYRYDVDNINVLSWQKPSWCDTKTLIDWCQSSCVVLGMSKEKITIDLANKYLTEGIVYQLLSPRQMLVRIDGEFRKLFVPESDIDLGLSKEVDRRVFGLEERLVVYMEDQKPLFLAWGN